MLLGGGSGILGCFAGESVFHVFCFGDELFQGVICGVVILLI